MVRLFTLAIGAATGFLTAFGQLAVGQVGMQMGVSDHSISVTPPAVGHSTPVPSAYNHGATTPPASDFHSTAPGTNDPSMINGHAGVEGGGDSACGPVPGRFHRLGTIGARGGIGGLKGWGGLSYFRSFGDMPPHYPYYPEMHGYYYFRPYNYVHVPQQQEFVGSYGGDRRDPYSHELFKVIYAEFKATLREKTPEVMPGAGSAVTPFPDTLFPETPPAGSPSPRQKQPESIPSPRAIELPSPAK
jgi:hypothetical protein